jgi:hypothetical protein
MPALRTFLALSALSIFGCHRTRPEPHPIPTSSTPVPVAAAPGTAHGTRKLKGLDIPVYVDGFQISVLRFGDTPSLPNIGSLDAPAFRLYDYLKAVGVVPENVKGIHLVSGFGTVGQLLGSELLSEKDRFKVQFASGETGIPEARWDTVGLKTTYIVHEIWKLSIFVKKDIPKVDPERRCYLSSDGTCGNAVPYASAEPVKGTRIYLDGRMVGFVKRRLVGNELVLGTTSAGDAEYSLAGFARKLGVDPSSIRGMELVAGDDVIARASASQWSKSQEHLAFTLPAHHHGKIRVRVPIDLQSTDATATYKDALVSSVKLYRNSSPSDRTLVTISEFTDLSVQLAMHTEREENKNP